MFSMPETSVHVLDKNREISLLEREEGYGEKDLEKRWVLRREWKTLWDTPTTDLGAESEPDDGGEHSEVADWQGTRRDGGSLFHRWGAAYRKERLLILRLDWACGWRRVTSDDEIKIIDFSAKIKPQFDDNESLMTIFCQSKLTKSCNTKSDINCK